MAENVFVLLNACVYVRIESSSSGENLIKRRLSPVYTSVGVPVCFFNSPSAAVPIYTTRPRLRGIAPVHKRLWINRGGRTPPDVLQRLLCLARKFNEKYPPRARRLFTRVRCTDKRSRRIFVFLINFQCCRFLYLLNVCSVRCYYYNFFFTFIWINKICKSYLQQTL